MTSIASIFPEVSELPQTFEGFLAEYARPLGKALCSYIPQGEHPGMDQYLYDPLIRYFSNGGKRHRPLICCASCMAVGGDVRLAMSCAAAIELLQSAALIHDDIADDSQLRRGQPCLHVTEGLGTAINIGDLSLALVQDVVLRDELLPDATKLRAARELAAVLTRTIEGQSLDIGWARDGRFDITAEDYLCMARHKTAYYSGAVPLALGAIVGGGSEAEIEALRSFGMETGLAFQVQDDLLNLVGEEGSLQKDFRNDITEGKRTLIVVHALEHSAQRERLVEILSAGENDPATLDEAVTIMEKAGSIDFARRFADEVTDAAKRSLVESISPSRARDILVSMADWFVERLR